MYKRYYLGWHKHLDFILWDVFSLLCAFFIAYLIRQGSLPFKSDIYRSLAVILVLVDILVAIAFNTMHNVLKRGYYIEAIQTLKHVLLVLLIITLYMFSMQSGEDYSRIMIFLTAGFHFVLGFCIRIAWKHVVRKRKQKDSKFSMLLVADEKQVPEILSTFRASEDVGQLSIVLSNRDGSGETIDGIPVVAGMETAADYICREWVDEVFLCPVYLKDVAVLIEACRQMAVPVHIRFPYYAMGDKSFIEWLGGYRVLTNVDNYASPVQFVIKRILDIAGGLVGSVVALVIIAVAGPKIKKESPGPVLFVQTRIGKNGKKFRIFKIRTMYPDAEERKKELMKDNRVSDGMMFKLDFDPRIIGNKTVNGKQVTGIGEKLRSGSWDEWPQFFNVLLGQMSLVGTRPPTVDEWEKYRYHHRARLATKPGITGMWQVSGRSKITDFEEVVKLDTEYINHWSIGLDLRIILKTVKTVFNKDGAM